MQHKHFNTILNNLKIASSQPGHPSSPLSYSHLHLVDSFFESDLSHDRDKIRVTRDEKTGEVLECLKKVRLASLDIYSPKRAADWRISVNVEVRGNSCRGLLWKCSQTHNVYNAVPQPLGSPSSSRRKDRISYSHEEFNIDLTQVTSNMGPNQQVQPFL